MVQWTSQVPERLAAIPRYGLAVLSVALALGVALRWAATISAASNSRCSCLPSPRPSGMPGQDRRFSRSCSRAWPSTTSSPSRFTRST